MSAQISRATAVHALITGITGFAGMHLGEHLAACGDRVLGTSRHGNWPDDAPVSLAKNVELVAWDVSHPADEELAGHVAEFAPDCIFHLAAVSVPLDCGRDVPTPQAIATNVEGTRSVAELAASLAKPPRVILISSCYVYGPVAADDARVDELAPVAPQSTYGITKCDAERVLLEAAQERDLSVVVARAFQHTGPRQSPRMFVPQWARQFARQGNEPIEVVRLDTFLDLADVRDVVRAYRALAEKGEPGEVYNVGSGVCRRSGDIFEIMRRIAGSNRGVVESSPGVRQHPIADITRLAARTGWKPEIPLETTLADVLAFWKARPRLIP